MANRVVLDLKAAINDLGPYSQINWVQHGDTATATVAATAGPLRLSVLPAPGPDGWQWRVAGGTVHIDNTAPTPTDALLCASLIASVHTREAA